MADAAALIAAAEAELKQTTVGYVGQPAGWYQNRSTHWRKALDLLEQAKNAVQPAGTLVGFATGYPSGSVFDPHMDLAGYVARAEAAGAQLLRFDIPVPAQDPGWASTIGRVRACKAAGMAVVLTPMFVIDPATYAANCVSAARALASLLDDRDWFELGNEVNLSGRLTADAYVLWHKNAAAAIRAVPGLKAQVATAGIAAFGSYGSASGGNYDMVSYAERWFAVDPRFGDWFDGLACHPYSYGDDWTIGQLEDQSQPWNGLGAALSHTHDLLRLLDANGCQSKPLLFTEVGAPTDGEGWTGGLSETVQAGYYTDLVKLARSNSRVAVLALYTLNDRTDLSGREAHFGVYRADGTAKLAVAAFR